MNAGTVLSTLFAASLLAVTTTAHELAHAEAMRALGIRLTEIRFGLNLPPRHTWQPTSRRPYPVQASPWLTSAFVRSDPGDQDRVNALRPRDRDWIDMSGGVANLICAAAFAAVGYASSNLSLAGLLGAGAAALFAGRRAIATWGGPVLSVVFMLFVVASVPIAFLGDTVGTGDLASLAICRSPRDALLTAAALSTLVGLSNMLPLPAVDGGHMALRAVQRRFGESAADLYAAGSVVLMGALCAANIVFLLTRI